MELGFADLRITDTHLERYRQAYQHWLAQGYHGTMEYLQRHQALKLDPTALQPGTTRIICVRMDYLPDQADTLGLLQQPHKAYIAGYALGRDYHKLMRKRLNTLAQRLQQKIGPFGYRAFVDSAPVMERALAEKAGLGWIGKNTLLLHAKAGSWFFLGELFTDLDLPVDPEQPRQHCGSCQRCLDLCPTQAFVAPWVLDARRCIAYLTIEFKGSIPLELRPLIGNRVFGCDDCQIFCPWTKFTPATPVPEFQPRHGLHQADLLTLFDWNEETFLQRTSGSAIRRIGYTCWQRNLAVALGNAPACAQTLQRLQAALPRSNALVAEHIQWAIDQQQGRMNSADP